MTLAELIRESRERDPRPPLVVVLLWWFFGDVLHVQPGDGVLRYVVTEPWDAWAFYRSRVACRVFGRCGSSCRGRPGHKQRRHGR